MNTVYTLDPHYAHLLPFVKEIAVRFHDDATTIHASRNTLKVFKRATGNIVVKSFKVPNIINQVAYSFFRTSKAQRSYSHSQQLLQLGIATPRPIAFVEQRRWGLFKQSYYICEHIEYDFEIRAVLNDAAFSDREQIFKAFAKFSYQLHEAGVYHVDYSPGNVLINKEGNTYSFNIVDVNRMKFISFTDELRMKNLSRFSASVEDTTRIARYYAHEAGLDPTWATQKLLFYHHKHQAYRQNKRQLKKLS